MISVHGANRGRWVQTLKFLEENPGMMHSEVLVILPSSACIKRTRYHVWESSTSNPRLPAVRREKLMEWLKDTNNISAFMCVDCRDAKLERLRRNIGLSNAELERFLVRIEEPEIKVIFLKKLLLFATALPNWCRYCNEPLFDYLSYSYYDCE